MKVREREREENSTPHLNSLTSSPSPPFMQSPLPASTCCCKSTFTNPSSLSPTPLPTVYTNLSSHGLHSPAAITTDHTPHPHPSFNPSTDTISSSHTTLPPRQLHRHKPWLHHNSTTVQPSLLHSTPAPTLNPQPWPLHHRPISCTTNPVHPTQFHSASYSSFKPALLHTQPTTLLHSSTTENTCFPSLVQPTTLAFPHLSRNLPGQLFFPSTLPACPAESSHRALLHLSSSSPPIGDLHL